MGSTIFYCPFCGSANSPGAKFCRKCGGNVEKYSRPHPPAEALTQPVDRVRNQASTPPSLAKSPHELPQEWAATGSAVVPPPVTLQDGRKAKKKCKVWSWIILALLALVGVFLVVIRVFDYFGQH